MVKKLFLGMVGGLIGGTVSVITGVLLTRLILLLLPRRSGGWEDLIFGILAVIVSYPLGAGLGAGLALRRFSRRGMVWKAILVAYAAEIGLMLLADPLRLNLNTNRMLGMIVLLPIAAILTVFWFNRQKGDTQP
ncbi:MAG: hypothetical protein AB1457_14940 [Chloroflexota bacterium]|nr:MAG: hypothetical protein KatS3mg045_1415 [Bellilinea sp.]